MTRSYKSTNAYKVAVAINAGFSRSVTPGESVGTEIETSFVDKQSGRPISLEVSQKIMQILVDVWKWQVQEVKGGLITVLLGKFGDKICYELGRQNFELVSKPRKVDELLPNVRLALTSLYGAAERCGAEPFFGPVLPTEEDLLIIPDERDANWLDLDGKRSLEFLSRISSVQFTVAVNSNDKMRYLWQLADKIDIFLDNYPQHVNWLGYVAGSNAGYSIDRYGGPLYFRDYHDYIQKLSKHDVVIGQKLVAIEDAPEIDVPLYLRSVWWHFRLKRYGDCICIEVRPIGRRSDRKLDEQLQLVMSCFD